MPIDREDFSVMDPQGMVDDSKYLKISAQGQALARFMAAVLDHHYKGWRWGITVDERGGVCHVFALELSGDMGYTVMLDDLYNGGNFDWTLVLVMGGEILERYGLPRGPKTPDWQGYVTWVLGIPIPDVSDRKAGLIKHFEKMRAHETTH